MRKGEQESLSAPGSPWPEQVGAIYDIVSARPRITFQEAGFLPVEPAIVLRIQEEAQLDVTGYVHIVDTDSIRHIIKGHSDRREMLRGQVPLVRDDFLILPVVFSAPETVESAGLTKQGLNTVRYVKALGEHRYYYVEELRTKKNRLAAVTLYKRMISGPTPDAPS